MKGLLKVTITASQCRAARALLDWTQDQLAENAQVARPTVIDFEGNIRTPMRNNLISIASTFEAAGVAFISDDGEGVGVRFRKVELEYSRSLKSANDQVLLAVKYRGQPYSVLISRDIIDDLDRASYQSQEEQVKAVQNHLPLFLGAAEQSILAGKFTADHRIVLAQEDLPQGAF